MRWLYLNDNMPLLLPDRERRDELIRIPVDVDRPLNIVHIGMQAVVYLLYSEVNERLTKRI